MTNCNFSNNGRHGVSVGKGANVDIVMRNTSAQNNGISGMHVEGDGSVRLGEAKPDLPWFQRPLGLIAIILVGAGSDHLFGIVLIEFQSRSSCGVGFVVSITRRTSPDFS